MYEALDVIRIAAQAGFRWTSVQGALDKMVEEISELACAESESERVDEVGDILFVAVSIAYYSDVDPTRALSLAVDKFKHRWAFVWESDATSFEGMCAAWEQYKIKERAK